MPGKRGCSPTILLTTSIHRPLHAAQRSRASQIPSAFKTCQIRMELIQTFELHIARFTPASIVYKLPTSA